MLTRVAGIQATLLPVALFWGEYYTIPATVASVVLVHAVGKPLVVGCTTDEDISEAEVFISAESAWFVAAAAGTLPFLGIAWTASLAPAGLSIPASAPDSTLLAFRSPVNAWFESISGFTGSGLTMARKESDLPRTLQWWRSLMQRIGGLGVIVLTITIVNESESNALSQYYGDRSPLGQFRNGDYSNPRRCWCRCSLSPRCSRSACSGSPGCRPDTRSTTG